MRVPITHTEGSHFSPRCLCIHTPARKHAHTKHTCSHSVELVLKSAYPRISRLRATLTLDTIPVKCTFASFSNRSKVTRFGVGMNMVHSLNYRVHTRTTDSERVYFRSLCPHNGLRYRIRDVATDSSAESMPISLIPKQSVFYTDSMTVPQTPIECIPCIPQNTNNDRLHAQITDSESMPGP